MTDERVARLESENRDLATEVETLAAWKAVALVVMGHWDRVALELDVENPTTDSRVWGRATYDVAIERIHELRAEVARVRRAWVVFTYGPRQTGAGKEGYAEALAVKDEVMAEYHAGEAKK